jgi:hypothetical protein
MEELDRRVKREFILLYSNQTFLKKFHETFLNTLILNNFRIIDVEPYDSNRFVDSLDKKMGMFLPKGESFKIVEIEQQLKTKTKILRYKIPSIPQTTGLDLDGILKSKYMIT